MQRKCFLGVVMKQFFSCHQIVFPCIFFTAREKNLVPRKKVLAARKKEFCHYIKKTVSSHQKHFCKCIISTNQELSDLTYHKINRAPYKFIVTRVRPQVALQTNLTLIYNLNCKLTKYFHETLLRLFTCF